MQIRLQSTGEVIRLDNSNFVAAGGEGKVWIVNGKAYKVYDDPSSMMPLGKIEDLSRIKDPRVIRPLDVITHKNKPVGYCMLAVINAVPLQATFTKAYREREGLSIDRILRRVQTMRETVANIHDANVLVVDMNELNELVETTGDSVFFIDTDSWQTPRFPATAIMESIRDRHMASPCDFNQGTDWFAFGILVHQMMRGVHPYKGKVDGFKPADLDGRMIANISVYSPGVRVSAAVYPESVVPTTYLEWFKAVFNDGKRLPPPVDFVTPARTITPTAVVKMGTGFIFTEILAGTNAPSGYVSLGRGQSFAIVNDWVINVANVSKRICVSRPPSIFLDDLGRPVLYDGTTITDINSVYPLIDYKSEAHMAYGGRLYVKSAGHLVELTISRKGNSARIWQRVVGNVMENATTLYPGCSVSQAIDRWLVNTLPQTGISYSYNLKELTGWRVLDVAYDSGVLVIYATETKTRKNKRFVWKEHGGHAKLFCEVEEPDTMSANFIVLENGVCILAEGDGIEIFHRDPAQTVVQKVSHQVVNAGVRLVKHEGMAAMISGNSVIAFRKG